MKKLLITSGGIVAAALACWLFVESFSGRVVFNQSFWIGGFEVRYYGLTLGAAILTSYFLARINAWRFGLSKEEIDRVAFWTVIAAAVGARIYFILFAFEYFSENINEIWQFWHGGLSIYGAILGGLVFLLIWTRKRIYSVWQILDLAALAMPLGQAIGRLGNFVNYEAYGHATSVPWKMFVPAEFRADLTQSYYHPVFLYEGLFSLGLFLLLMKLRGRVKPGVLALTYLMSYSAIRFFLEPLRVDSVFIGGFRADQAVSVIVFLAAGLMFWRLFKRSA
jgi:phosphatidylglycerol---prolipoprotein diacylglyceryl transferase